MEKQPNISSDQWAKILSSGSFLCWRGSWWFFTTLSPSINFENNKENQLVIFDFFGSSGNSYKAQRILGPFSSAALRESIAEYLADLKPEKNPFSWFPPHQEDFLRSFSSVMDKIISGEIKKAVPISFLEGRGQLTSFQLAQFILKLCDAPQTLIPYGFWHDDSGFIGATPEILYSRFEDQFETMALAGTAPQDFSKSQDLLNDPKERHEHQLVIQDIEEKLFNLVDLNFAPTTILELPHLRHLHTAVKGRIQDLQATNDLEIIQRLHPTSALGVYPRQQGINWLLDLPEQKERKNFGAPILYNLPDGNVVTLVGLRRLEWSHQDIRIGAGCGLVRESIFAREWLEVTRKIESVRKLLGI